jgi:hypothetical protein
MGVLAILTHTIRQATIEGKHSLVVYLDIQGAFDSVWHHILIYKMINLEFETQLTRWMYNYLKDRTTSVQVGNCLSKEKPLDRGLPQGAVLSPTNAK